MDEMTTIRATCPDCGEVEMEARAITLNVRDEDGEGTYSFTCPVCSESVEKPADRKVVMLLLSAGVDVTRIDTPVLTAELRPEGPPLTADDLIDFHFLLEGEDWFRQLAATA